MTALVEMVCGARYRGRLTNCDAVRALVLPVPVGILIRIYKWEALPDRRLHVALREVSV
jgi:hypothetical protein